MKINIYKFIDSDETKIYTSFCNEKKENIKIRLFRNNILIKEIKTKNDNYLFENIITGEYYVDLLVGEEKNKPKIRTSNKIKINASIKNSQRKKLDNPIQKKHTNKKIDGINSYYLEIKIIKNALSKSDSILKEIKDKLRINITPVKLNLSGVDYKSSIHNYEYYIYNEMTDFEKLLELSEKIEVLDYVDYCCVTPNTANYLPLDFPFLPENKDVTYNSNINNENKETFKTPCFVPLQTYLNQPQGMNIINAWDKGINGSRATVRHLDFGLYQHHEDFKNSNIKVVHSRPETEDCNHGTASTGCIVASKNDFGVTGIAYGCHYYFYDTGDLDLIINDVNVGDIVSLDIQFLVNGQYLPATAILSWWEKIKIIINKGAIVILAAGNGGLDLSQSDIMVNYGDNGSILVGACYHKTGKRASFSNYNQDNSLLNSWGDWSVTTTGYGALQKLPGNERNYTNNYSGTSSATPLCSGALALIQDYAMKHHLILSAWSMRDIIKKSNYTEGVVDGIGYRPNVDYLLYQIDKLIFSDIINQYPDYFLKSALFISFNIDINNKSELNYLFEYDSSPVDRVGFVLVNPEQGSFELQWCEYGYTLVSIPVVNKSNNIEIIKLKISKKNDCGSFTMNSAASCDTIKPNSFYLQLLYLTEDNPYVEIDKYEGILPLQAKAWYNDNYCLNIMINIQLN